MPESSEEPTAQGVGSSVPSQPVADEVLLGAADLARAALAGITSPASVGAPAGHIVEGEGVLSLLFENTMAGYPGWFWTVSLSREPDTGEVNVLEAELMPGESALLAPDWVPWADRLAEYQAQQKALREAAEAAGEEAPEDEFVSDAELDDEDDADEASDDLDDDDEDDDFVEGYGDDELEEHELDEELEFDESDDIRSVEQSALGED